MFLVDCTSLSFILSMWICVSLWFYYNILFYFVNTFLEKIIYFYILFSFIHYFPYFFVFSTSLQSIRLSQNLFYNRYSHFFTGIYKSFPRLVPATSFSLTFHFVLQKQYSPICILLAAFYWPHFIGHILLAVFYWLHFR